MPETPAYQIKTAKEWSPAGDHYSVAHLPHTDQLFVGGHTGKLQRVDLAEEKPQPIVWDAHVSYISSLVLTSKYLISAGSDHQVIWWNRESRERVRAVAHPKWVRHLSISPDGQILASVCDDMIGRLWEVESGQPIRELQGHALLTPFDLVSKLYAAAFSRDGKRLATVDQAGHALVWETATGQKLADIHAPLFYTHDTNGHTYGGIRSVDFSPDGQQIALGGNLAGDTSTITGSKSLMQVYDWQTGKLVAECQAGGDFFYERVKFHNEGKWLLGAGGAGNGAKLVLFDLASQALLAEVKLPSPAFDIALNESSDTCFTVGRGKVGKWAITSGS
ncbi:MAG: WD40 repeat domain-containing protein [Planctomycetota bacterium]